MEGVLVSILWMCFLVVAADRHVVFWNSTNARFLRDHYSVEVKLNDYLDIICPHYEPGDVPSHMVERYTLYMVEEEEYRSCKPTSQEQVRWKCNKPFALHGPEKFSEKFQRFTPIALGKDFKEGQSYYYISKPLHHHGESCLKLQVTVAKSTDQSNSKYNVHTSRPRVQSDEPSLSHPNVLKSFAKNSAISPVSFSLFTLLLPFLVKLFL
ncbi:ephrin-A1 [Latimeria chalumnae]|uniref:ephrin-A1 n=1 Tax=Latimeria chalumnae TaxID=7897 RepID=UPI0006D92609|nr:PREDICTED: ephrin-A1 [Latimeria chalumnae]|eukprot:XP_014350811.1 PREDICTED: ephrin-A1 [Latimeria chalumnae]